MRIHIHTRTLSKHTHTHTHTHTHLVAGDRPGVCDLLYSNNIYHIKNKSLPFSWESSLIKITQERKLALEVCSLHKVYGFNTLPGHRDSENIADREITNFQYDLIKSHDISNGIKYSNTTIKYFLFCKLMSINHSGTGISPTAYKSIFNITTVPLRINKKA